MRTRVFAAMTLHAHVHPTVVSIRTFFLIVTFRFVIMGTNNLKKINVKLLSGIKKVTVCNRLQMWQRCFFSCYFTTGCTLEPTLTEDISRADHSSLPPAIHYWYHSFVHSLHSEFVYSYLPDTLGKSFSQFPSFLKVLQIDSLLENPYYLRRYYVALYFKPCRRLQAR